MEKRKTAETISSELGIPLSTTYRKIKELRKAGLLVVEKSAITKNGKLCDLYRSTIKGVRVHLDLQPPSLDLTFNEDVYDKISRVWHALREVR
jgi:predicted transcriptional regulator